MAASAGAAGVGGVDVTISDGAGKLVYRGKTDRSGAFATQRVRGGDYVVQLNAPKAEIQRTDYAIFAAAGKQRVVADAVAGRQLTGSGVAMRLKLKTDSTIFGQLAVGGVKALGTKIENGRRYVLVASETGSNLGPQWVEEGLAPARDTTQISVDDPAFIKANAIGVAR